MTKKLKAVISEKDQMYSEYVKDISLQFVGRLSGAVSEVLFDGDEVSIIVEDINVIPHNSNYIALVMLVTKGPEKLEKEEVRMGNTITFAIPTDILEKGSTSDIKEYLDALKDDPNAKGKPIPAESDDPVEYAQKIIDRVNKKAEELATAKKEQGSQQEYELDEIQKALMKITHVNETKH